MIGASRGGRIRLDGRTYDRLFDRCATENQLAQVQIRLENRMTPAEAAVIAEHIARRYVERGLRRRITWLRIERDRRRQGAPVVGVPRYAPRYLLAVQAGQWAEGVLRQLATTGRPIADVERAWVRGGATMYRPAIEGARTLVIGFSGNLRGFMMPTHMFLQFMGGSSTDVLKLEVPRGIGYIEGVPGFSRDFPSTLDWLSTVISSGGYSRVVTFGTSGGGLPALLAGARLEADAALAVGAAAHMNAAEMAAQLGAPTVLDVLRTAAGRTSMTVLYGQDSARDAESVEFLRPALPGASILAVPDAGHACLFELVERGEFGSLVATALLKAPAARP